MSTDRVSSFFSPPGPATQAAVRSVIEDAYAPASPLVPPTGDGMRLDDPGGRPLTQVVEEVHSHIAAHAVQPRHPWALAHMAPPPTTVSVIADLLIGALNQCAFIWEEAPLAARLEAETIQWLADRIGFEHPGGMLTSGGTLSNCVATYLALAAHPSANAPESCAVVASESAHLSIDKAAALTGLGMRAIVRAETDAEGRVVPGGFAAAAERALSHGRTPILVVCSGGTTNAGKLEPADEALAVARAHGAWCHVDAAHGGFVTLVRGYEERTEPWSRADSVSWDAHKMLYTSYAVGALLLRDPERAEALRFQSDYALKAPGLGDAGELHLEGSRRFEALKLWMSIRHLGADGFAALAEQSLARARALAARIDDHDDLELLTEPETNIVCFRFVDSGVSAADLDVVNARVQRALFRSGGPLLSTTRLGGRIALRAVVLNPALCEHHFDAILARVVSEAQRGRPARARPTCREVAAAS